jgi:hypothetical protein
MEKCAFKSGWFCIFSRALHDNQIQADIFLSNYWTTLRRITVRTIQIADVIALGNFLISS